MSSNGTIPSGGGGGLPFCDSGGFGVSSTGFTPCVNQMVIQILPVLFILVVGPLRLRAILRAFYDVTPMTSKRYAAKILLSGVNLLAPLLQMIVAAATAASAELMSVSFLLSGLLRSLAWTMGLLVLVKEHRRALPQSWRVLRGWWLLHLVAEAIALVPGVELAIASGQGFQAGCSCTVFLASAGLALMGALYPQDCDDVEPCLKSTDMSLNNSSRIAISNGADALLDLEEPGAALLGGRMDGGDSSGTSANWLAQLRRKQERFMTTRGPGRGGGGAKAGGADENDLWSKFRASSATSSRADSDGTAEAESKDGRDGIGAGAAGAGADDGANLAVGAHQWGREQLLGQEEVQAAQGERRMSGGPFPPAKATDIVAQTLPRVTIPRWHIRSTSAGGHAVYEIVVRRPKHLVAAGGGQAAMSTPPRRRRSSGSSNRDSAGPGEYTTHAVHKRFSQFYELDKAVRRELAARNPKRGRDQGGIPPFPARVLGAPLDNQFLNNRRRALEIWLQGVAHGPSTQCESLTAFLGHPAPAPADGGHGRLSAESLDDSSVAGVGAVVPNSPSDSLDSDSLSTPSRSSRGLIGDDLSDPATSAGPAGVGAAPGALGVAAGASHGDPATAAPGDDAMPWVAARRRSKEKPDHVDGPRPADDAFWNAGSLAASAGGGGAGVGGGLGGGSSGGAAEAGDGGVGAGLRGLVLEMQGLAQDHARRLCMHHHCFLEADVTEWLQLAPQQVREAYPTAQLLLRLSEEGLVATVGIAPDVAGSGPQLFRLTPAAAPAIHVGRPPLDELFQETVAVRVTGWEEATENAGGAGGGDVDGRLTSMASVDGPAASTGGGGLSAAAAAAGGGGGGGGAGGGGSRFVQYLVEVATPTESWITTRRYSEFRALNRQLSQLFPGASSSLPNLPSKVRHASWPNVLLPPLARSTCVRLAQQGRPSPLTDPL